MNPELPKYPAVPPPSVPHDPVAKSVSRDGAFSKPGSTKSAPSKGWSPAKGTRFRSTAEKAPGRPRKRKADPRNVKFF